MPELPDIEVYLAALRPRVVGATLERVRVAGVSLLRSYDPPLDAAHGREVVGLRRLGKRIVIRLDADLALVVHLMVAGRLAWHDDRGVAVPKKVGLAGFDFTTGTLVLREAATRKRASLHLVRGEAALADHDRGGVEPLEAGRDQFAAELTRDNRTLKRALTDPRRFAGIGNAYSDEILHAARLSPVKRSRQLQAAEIDRLHEATRQVLGDFTARLLAATGEGFPGKVTAFRPDFAVHGRYGQACPVCRTTVARIRYADNETNYCPRCQTGGKLLADRSLSRLLKDDWPATVDEAEGA